VERDEKLYPPRGSWPRFRGKVGVVVVPANYGEVGVAVARPSTPLADLRAEAWFLPHELTVLARREDGARQPVGTGLSASEASVRTGVRANR
jgi:hypothetical protein